jgi:hypothetical protein
MPFVVCVDGVDANVSTVRRRVIIMLKYPRPGAVNQGRRGRLGREGADTASVATRGQQPAGRGGVAVGLTLSGSVQRLNIPLGLCTQIVSPGTL